MRDGQRASTELSCRSIEVRRPRLARVLGWGGVLVLLLGLFVLAPALGRRGMLVGVAVAVASWIASALVGTTRRSGGAVTLERDGLRVEQGQRPPRHVPSSAIRAGFEVPTDQSVVLELRDGTAIALAMSGDDPRRVLEHAGAGPTQRAVTMPLRRTLGAFTIGLLTFATSLVGGVILAGALRFAPLYMGTLPLAVILTVLAVMRLGFPRVVVGADGIRVLGVLRTRFIPHEDVARVEVFEPPSVLGGDEPPHVRMHRRGGPHLDLPMIAMPREIMEALALRIEEAAAAHRRGGARRLDALGRGERSIDAWRRDIERLAAAAHGFRGQALGRDDFDEVLLDPSAPADQRIGAALALRALDPEVGPARIRIAAGSSADESLRAAFEAAAEGELDEPAIERATERKRSG